MYRIVQLLEYNKIPISNEIFKYIFKGCLLNNRKSYIETLIKKVLNYFNKMDDPLFFEGKGSNNKYFDMVFAPYLSINNNYFRNAEDIIQYNIYESNWKNGFRLRSKDF